MRIKKIMKKLSKFKENFQLSTFNFQLYSESGQTLLEAVVALATAVVIISAMTVIVLSSLNNAQFSKNQNQATQYAQQAVEFLKNLSQSNWATFATYTLTNYCMPSDNSLPARVGLSCGPNPNVGIFLREVTINQYAAGNIDTSCVPTSVARALVAVSVGWADSKCTSTTDIYCHKVKLISCIYSTTIPTP